MNTRKKTGKAHAPEGQSALFIQTARDLGCDESTDTDEVMKRLAAQKRHGDTDKSAKKSPKKAARPGGRNGGK